MGVQREHAPPNQIFFANFSSLQKSKKCKGMNTYTSIAFSSLSTFFNNMHQSVWKGQTGQGRMGNGI